MIEIKIQKRKKDLYKFCITKGDKECSIDINLEDIWDLRDKMNYMLVDRCRTCAFYYPNYCGKNPIGCTKYNPF